MLIDEKHACGKQPSLGGICDWFHCTAEAILGNGLIDLYMCKTEGGRAEQIIFIIIVTFTEHWIFRNVRAAEKSPFAHKQSGFRK